MTAHDPTGDSRQESDEATIDLAERADDSDVSRLDVDAPEPTFTSRMWPNDFADDGTDVSVSAVHYADGGDESVVEIEARFGDGSSVGLTFDAAAARRLARQIDDAARHATTGDRRVVDDSDTEGGL